MDTAWENERFRKSKLHSVLCKAQNLAVERLRQRGTVRLADMRLQRISGRKPEEGRTGKVQTTTGKKVRSLEMVRQSDDMTGEELGYAAE